MKVEEMIGQAMRLPISTISYGLTVRNWCFLEYPNHPDGCQNYLDKDWCPPKVAEFPAGIDISSYDETHGHNYEMSLLRLKPGLEPTMWLFIRHFDLQGWVKGLRKEHPQMSDNQARIPYLYNDKVYRQIYADAEAYRWVVGRPTILLRRPEANGVNLFATCRVNGGPQLEKNPRNDTYFMAILGECGS